VTLSVMKTENYIVEGVRQNGKKYGHPTGKGVMGGGGVMCVVLRSSRGGVVKMSGFSRGAAMPGEEGIGREKGTRKGDTTTCGESAWAGDSGDI